jgi:Glyoxalase/Bleomycin resistance protein/Dioxygenase superfamily
MQDTLFRKHFQTSYVARDIEKTSALFGEKFGVAKWHVLDALALVGDAAPVKSIATAYAGNVMLELIEPIPGRESIYDGWLNPGQDLRFHHHGYSIDDDAEMGAVRELLDRAGITAIPTERVVGPVMAAGLDGILEFLYADTVDELGHYCEFVHLKPAGREFFAQTPHNG